MTQVMEFSLIFEVPPKVIYNALVDPFEISRYTRNPTQFKAEPNETFSLYSGRIVGKFLELELNKRIKQEWKFENWKEFSVVEINIKERDDDSCKVEIKQSGIPWDQEVKKLIEGWKGNIFKPMSQICGYPIEDED